MHDAGNKSVWTIGWSLTLRLWNRNEQTNAHAKRLFMPFAEIVSVAWFQIPTELSFRPRPEHELDRGLPTDRIDGLPAARCMHPFRSNTELELHCVGKRKGLLEEEIGGPLRVTAAKERGNTGFDFQPLLYGRDFYGCRRAEAGAAFSQPPIRPQPRLPRSQRVPFPRSVLLLRTRAARPSRPASPPRD